MDKTTKLKYIVDVLQILTYLGAVGFTAYLSLTEQLGILDDTVTMPIWAFIVFIILFILAGWGYYRMATRTRNLEESGAVLRHIAKNLRKYHKRYKGRIVVYRVLPFEFSRQMYTARQWTNELSDALDMYIEDMGKIIGFGEGTDFFWDKTIYGFTKDEAIDAASWGQINRLYLTREGFDDNAPDTCELGISREVNKLGMFLVGKLDAKGKKPQKWVCGYEIYVNISDHFVDSTGSMFSTNPQFLNALHERIKDIIHRVELNKKYYSFSSNLDEKERQERLKPVKEMFLNGRQTKKEKKAYIKHLIKKIS